jgi:hypothetical protein
MQELASAPVPEDGLWLMPSDRGRFAGAPQGWLPVSEQLEWISESGEPVSAGAGDLVVSVTGRKVAPLRLPSLSQWRPMQGATSTFQTVRSRLTPYRYQEAPMPGRR